MKTAAAPSRSIGETVTLLLMNAVSRGEFVTAETRKPGLYGIGGPGAGGSIVIARHEARGLVARLDVSADGSFKVYPVAATRTQADAERGFWLDILAEG